MTISLGDNLKLSYGSATLDAYITEITSKRVTDSLLDLRLNVVINVPELSASYQLSGIIVSLNDGITRQHLEAIPLDRGKWQGIPENEQL